MFGKIRMIKEIQESVAAYKSYTTETSRGKWGKTANCWIYYVNTIHLYHEFSLSIRNVDLDLFMSSLLKITNYSFVLNQLNMLGRQ